ncbi:hypothetical protein JL720_5585 [Aureococcus anophagefferens]|nr:hypothetical protein JL720_5585 [Aureococcus anophagefferens]
MDLLSAIISTRARDDDDDDDDDDDRPASRPTGRTGADGANGVHRRAGFGPASPGYWFERAAAKGDETATRNLAILDAHEHKTEIKRPDDTIGDASV